MSNLVISSRLVNSALLTMLAAAAAASAVACSKPEDEKKQAWSCARDEVPMGEVVRCTSSAATADGPLLTSGTGAGAYDTTAPTDPAGSTAGATADGTTNEGTGGGGTTYECGTDNVSDDCPPADAAGSTVGGAVDGTTAGSSGGGGTAAGSETGAAPNGSQGNTASGSSSGGPGSGGPGNGNGGNSSGGHTSDGTTNGSSNGANVGNGNGSGGTSHQPGPDECSYVPDLDYCSGAGGAGGASGAGASSSGGGATDCTKSNCDAPGQDKKGTTDGTGASSSSGGASSSGASSSGASSSGASGGASSGGASSGSTGGKSWKCTKDKKGDKSCVSTPDCATGTHASACGACVSDSDGASDCVPPSEGGCWITGGGYIVGASLVPAAAADGHDNFGGNAKPMKKGGVSGHWNHVDHGTGNHAKGRPEYIMCRVTDGPGPKQPGGKKGLVANQVYFGGHAQWRNAATATWSDGYWFDVVAEDHGEPGNTHALKNGEMPDSYHFTIRKIDNAAAGASGTVVYETRDDLRGGNIQIHPSNNGHPALSSPLPAWVSIEQ